jgi:membrane protein involved in colicin uptake
MIKKALIISAFITGLLTFAGQTFAEDQQPAATGPLMTQQETQAFQEKMRNAKTPQERQQIQQQHHEQLQQRAKARNEAQRKLHEERVNSNNAAQGAGMGGGSAGGKGK